MASIEPITFSRSNRIFAGVELSKFDWCLLRHQGMESCYQYFLAEG
jgi:hypothetical protein